MLKRVEFFSCEKVLAYCCMSNHIHVFIFLEEAREKEMQRTPPALAENCPKKPKSPLQRYRLLSKGRDVLAWKQA